MLSGSMRKGRLSDGGGSRGKGRMRIRDDDDEEDDARPSIAAGSQAKRARPTQRSSADAHDHRASQNSQAASQAATSQRPGGGELSGSDRKKIVAAMVRYLLFADRKKVPFKRTAIIDHVPGLKEYSRSFSSLLDDAAAQLREVIGFDLAEIPASAGKQWVLVNILDTENLDSAIDVGPEAPNRGLLMAILTLILMKEHSIGDEDLYIFLERLGIDRNKKHKIFGDIDKVLQQWVQQKYLGKAAADIQDDSSKKAYCWEWGPRAKEEVDRDSCVTFAAEMYEQPPEDWREEFRSLLTEPNADR